jgi:multiple sugar transport system substrate-binding protein
MLCGVARRTHGETRRKAEKKLFPFLVMFLLLAGCGRSSETVSFMVFGDPEEFAAYQSLVEGFTAVYPDINVELRHTPSLGEYRQRLAAGFSAGTPPDVMLLNYRRIGVFARQGAFEPLGPYLAQSDLLHEADFFPEAIAAFYLDGELWCIPQNVSSLVVYYNQDLFEAAGLAVPHDEWTWDEFLVAARALTLDLNGDGRIDQYGASIEPSLYRLAPFIWQNGGELVDDPAQPTRLALDSQAALEAFTWFANLQVVEGVVPSAVAESAESSESRFLNGRLAMYFNSRRGVPTYRTITGFTWDIAPLPRHREAAGILHSDAYCMAAATTNKEAAWTFIEYANSVEGQQRMLATGRTVPSLRQVANSPQFLEPELPPLRSHIFLDTLPVMRQVPTIHQWVTIEETANREIERAFYGQVSVQEAAETAVQRTQTYFQPLE